MRGQRRLQRIGGGQFAVEPELQLPALRMEGRAGEGWRRFRRNSLATHYTLSRFSLPLGRGGARSLLVQRHGETSTDRQSWSLASWLRRLSWSRSPLTVRRRCRSEEHTSELQSLMRTSSAVF